MLKKLILLLLLAYSFCFSETYILKSSSTIQRYKKMGMDSNQYLKSLEKMDSIIKNFGYKTALIDEHSLKNLKVDDSLILLDTLSLNEKAIDEVIEFVKNGGSLLFNFNSAFNKNSFLINRITGFKKYKHINLKKRYEFVTPKILSPLTKYISSGKRLNFVLYEKIPLFEVPSHYEPDIVATNWQQITKDIKGSGVAWHGEYGEGRWVYFNFPAYSILDTSSELEDFTDILKGVMEYLNRDVIVRKFPYLDKQNSIFISEDTEYKYENFRRYAKLAQKYKIPLTAFCVADLSDKNRDIFNFALNSGYIEIASHSTTHQKIVGKSEKEIRYETIGSKKILDSLNKKVDVKGFRPPREEVDETMLNLLIEGGYSYIMEKNRGRLYPFFEYSGILTIPRAPTDDYQYLVLLEQNSLQILKQMKYETRALSYLNGVYAFSLHTHLMAFESNIEVLDKYLLYLQNNPHLIPMSGKELVDKSLSSMNIELKTEIISKNLVEIKIDNRNKKDIKNFSFRLYMKPNYKIKKIKSKLKITYKKRDKLNEYDFVVKKLKANSKGVKITLHSLYN